MIVNVTQENINKGKRGNPSCCPVALALQDLGMKDVNVGTYYFDKEDSKHIRLPKEVTVFISRFDACHKVAPLSFEVLIVPKQL